VIRPPGPHKMRGFVDSSPPIMDIHRHLAELSARVDGLLLRDRGVVARRLQSARKRLAEGQPIDLIVSQVQKMVADSAAVIDQRNRQKFAISYDDNLPIARHRDAIAQAVGTNQVVVLCGDTGSGKTTQLPKILLELGRGVSGTIGHTQPRRIAARSVAQRIADELNAPLGDVVGYKVRFSDKTTPATRVKLMTDGILLAETQNDRALLEYDTIVIDEAHERSLNIDFLLGYLKQLFPRRPDLKLIITSATIDPERFSKHFDNAPVISVEGRTYPVEVRYRPLMSDDPEDAGLLVRDGLVSAIEELWSEAAGDTLVFLPGEREIREAADSLGAARLQQAEVLPLYARLSVAEQLRVFAPGRKPRIVLTTNVAETSITVPGIRYVIDTGVARISRYSARNKLQRLPIEPISRASADQRKGRCGRVGPGVCVRLYSEKDFDLRPQFTDPEILRTNLASVILQMKAYGLGRIEEFGFIEPPDYRQVKDGYQTLYELGAIDESNEITDLGRIMARLPIDPKVSRMILAARQFDCLREVLIIAAGLSVQDPRDRPMDKQGAADAAHAAFRVGGSDFLGYLNLWNAYAEQERSVSNNRLRKWCQSNFLSAARMREWGDVLRQLVELTSEMSWNRNTKPADDPRIHQALLAGLLSQVGRRGDNGEYSGTRGKAFWLFPGSSLFHKKPAWVMAAEVVETTKPYARIAAEIQPEWIERAAPHLVKHTYFEPHWQRKTGRVMAYEKVLLHGLQIIAKRSIPYESIDPKKSRELFIHYALVEGDVDLDAPFLRHNQTLLRDIELLEARTRRRDILVDVSTRYAFYDTRIPASVTGLQTFNSWRREAEHQNKRLLFMQQSDLMLRTSADVGAEQFPTTLSMSAGTFKLAYHFEPGAVDDGVTIVVPLAQLNGIDADRLDWLVPGLIEERLLDLIRTLPKAVRVNVVPAPDYAARSNRIMTFGQGNLYEAFAVALGKLTGMKIRAEDLRPAELADYLKMNIAVIDDAGRPVAQGRDVHELRRRLRDRIRELLAREIDPKWHRDGLTTWDVGDLPERVEIRRGGGTLQAFPGLIDLDGKHAALRLFDSPAAARAATRTGVRRLFVIEYANELSWHVKDLPDWRTMCLHYAPLGTSDALKNQMIEALAHQLITPDAADVRTRMEYELQLKGAWNRLTAESKRLAHIASRSLAEYHAVSLKVSKKVPDLMAASVDDMRQQLRWLMPADFMLSTPKAWLEHLPRYLKAMNIRMTKLLDAGVRRDCDRLLEVAPRWQNYLDLKKTWPAGQPETPTLERYRWLIEELRVSLFAQELGTTLSISPKRVDDAWTELVSASGVAGAR
jgi:ATP-dependent helicase HrpA